MDESIDPCEDFYQFSCGSFEKNKRLQEDQTKIDEFSILRDKLTYVVADLLAEPENENDTHATINAKKLFNSCMDELNIEEKGIDRVLEIIENDLGGWPILQGDKYDPKKHTSQEKLLMLNKIDSSQLFQIHVTTNPKNPKQNVLRATQPGFFFNKEYLNDENIMNEYNILMRRIIGYMYSGEKVITREIDRIFLLEKEFSMLQLSAENRRSQTYKNSTIKELAESIPEFDWKSFIIDSFNNFANVSINENETIIIDDFSYLSNASKLFLNLTQTNKSDLDNLLVWLFIKQTISFLPKRFQEAKLKFDRIFDGTSVKQPRTLSCSNYVNSKMEFAVGRLYVQRYFLEEQKKDVVQMINNLLDEFKKILNESDWMNAESKKIALEKVNFMDSKIAYSDAIYNNTFLDEYYQGYEFENEDFFENYYTTLKVDVYSSLIELKRPQDPKDWVSGPAVVNAFYSPSSNQICFPAGILQSPFYDYSNPKYLNYGAIGTVIGHEITHGFDDQGRLYDKDGIFFSDHEGLGLWTNDTIESYNKKAQCIIDQYSGFVVQQVGKNLSGINTQGENIADNGGLKEAYRAYKNWASKNGPEPFLPGLEKFTPDQMFFIGFGQLWCGKTRDQALNQAILEDPHSPGEFRIIGATSNSLDFSKAFNCKLGQKNNPIEKCSVW